jgi:hypothetical protein
MRRSIPGIVLAVLALAGCASVLGIEDHELASDGGADSSPDSTQLAEEGTGTDSNPGEDSNQVAEDSSSADAADLPESIMESEAVEGAVGESSVEGSTEAAADGAGLHEACASACTSNQTRCTSGMLQKCVAGDAGCMEWGPATACACSACSGNSCVNSNWCQDADNDGHGNPNVTMVSCQQPAGYIAGPCDDCCDTDKNAYPGSTYCSATKDACNSYDYNCDGQSSKCGVTLNGTCPAGCGGNYPECTFAGMTCSTGCNDSCPGCNWDKAACGASYTCWATGCNYATQADGGRICAYYGAPSGGGGSAQCQ